MSAIPKTWHLRLGRLLAARGINQKNICPFAQTKGVQVSPAVINRIIKNNEWPKRENFCAQIKSVCEQFAVEKLECTAENVSDIWAEDTKGGVTVTEVHEAMHMKRTKAQAEEPTTEFIAPENEMLEHNTIKHFGLAGQPFDNEINCLEDIYLNQSLLMNKEAMINAATTGGMISIIGECGSGKSILKELFVDELEDEHPYCQIIEPATLDRHRITTSSVTAAVFEALHIDSIPQSIEQRDRLIRREVKKLAKEGKRFVFLVDEAHALHYSVIKQLKCLREAAGNLTKVIGVILLGQPELHETLSGSNTREFSWRCKRMETRALGDETQAYIEFKLKRARKAFDDVFSDDAVAAIKQRLCGSRSNGINRNNSIVDMTYQLHVNNLCNEAMNVAARVSEPLVSAAIIKKCRGAS
ncbi:ExeA family protein [Catenovulum sediminis]|uniref:ExeA family protein n=1 Tax=Catenovulum sediminis TaxID=1740262 RepID=UPI00117D6CF7|nr:AAA family ATPase [Catenovulum sediminis]